MSHPTDIDSDEFEVVDALPVLASDGRSALSYARPEGASLAAVPKRQVIAVAASSFLAGVATLALVQARKGAKVQPRRVTKASPGFGDVIGSERFLLDLHRLQRP